jgi:Fe-S-cluster containining protein
MSKYSYDQFCRKIDNTYQSMNEFCLKCDCCNSYAWLMRQEVEFLLKENIKIAEVNNTGFLIDSFPKDRRGRRKVDIIPLCRYYNKNRCSCYNFRPMYCRLYPLIIKPLDNSIVFQWDLSCSFIKIIDKKKLKRLQKEIVILCENMPRNLFNSIIELYKIIYKLTPKLEYEEILSDFAEVKIQR